MNFRLSSQWLSRLGLSLAVILSAIILSATANAQVLYGSMVGNVVDNNGAAVPGAKVKITNKATNQSREATTNPEGA